MVSSGPCPASLVLATSFACLHMCVCRQVEAVNDFISLHRIEEVVDFVDSNGFTLLMLASFYGMHVGMCGVYDLRTGVNGGTRGVGVLLQATVRATQGNDKHSVAVSTTQPRCSRHCGAIQLVASRMSILFCAAFFLFLFCFVSASVAIPRVRAHALVGLCMSPSLLSQVLRKLPR